MNIYLIGVSHDFQIPPQDNFEEYVFEACIKYKIKSIGEKMCKDALDDFNVSQSTVKSVAEKCCLPHIYCGPGKRERKARGISGESLLTVQRMHQEWTEDKFREELQKDRKKRETIWLERLKTIYENPMLFVCGIAHLETFGSLLKKNGFDCTIFEKKWDSR